MHNLHIQLNANIIKELKHHDLYVDHMGTSLAIMLALQEERYDLLDEFDDNNNNKRAIILYRQLERRGFLENTKNKPVLYQLTPKGNVLLDFVRSEYEKEDKILAIDTLDEVKKVNIISTGKSADWINEYINLFPKDLQDHPRIVAKRMDEFINQYNYPKDLILGATKYYINEQQNSPSGHQFTRRSIYFIYKGKGVDQVCDLATWCIKYEDKGKSSELDMSFKDMA